MVVTGDRALAGTDSNVFITIYGKTGATHKIHLKRKTDHTFQQGHSDTFKIHGNCVGPMQRIRIEHDNKGVAPGWFLERVSKSLLGPQIRGRNWKKIHFLTKTYVVGSQKNRLNETVLLNTQNTCFN